MIGWMFVVLLLLKRVTGFLSETYNRSFFLKRVTRLSFCLADFNYSVKLRFPDLTRDPYGQISQFMRRKSITN